MCLLSFSRNNDTATTGMSKLTAIQCAVPRGERFEPPISRNVRIVECSRYGTRLGQERLWYCQDMHWSVKLQIRYVAKCGSAVKRHDDYRLSYCLKSAHHLQSQVASFSILPPLHISPFEQSVTTPSPTELILDNREMLWTTPSHEPFNY